ncbi:MAG: hypothetical protein LBO00_06560 [Zoogloeaceae bacterium]|nr:hypothetical protein [Zoogloeaceae bacterium]
MPDEENPLRIKPFTPPPPSSRLLLSGNEAITRAVWEAGVAVAAAYPGAIREAHVGMPEFPVRGFLKGIINAS